jgi:hypothetical protein
MGHGKNLHQPIHNPRTVREWRWYASRCEERARALRAEVQTAALADLATLNELIHTAENNALIVRQATNGMDPNDEFNPFQAAPDPSPDEITIIHSPLPLEDCLL